LLLAVHLPLAVALLHGPSRLQGDTWLASIVPSVTLVVVLTVVVIVVVNVDVVAVVVTAVEVVLSG